MGAPEGRADVVLRGGDCAGEVALSQNIVHQYHFTPVEKLIYADPSQLVQEFVHPQ